MDDRNGAHPVHIEFLDNGATVKFFAKRVETRDGWIVLQSAYAEYSEPSRPVDIAYPASRIRLVMTHEFKINPRG